MLRSIHCAYCGRPYVHEATAGMLRSERFPSVYLHGGTCHMALFNYVRSVMGIDEAIPFVMELTEIEKQAT